MITYDRFFDKMGIIHIGNAYVQYEKKKCNHAHISYIQHYSFRNIIHDK